MKRKEMIKQVSKILKYKNYDIIQDENCQYVVIHINNVPICYVEDVYMYQVCIYEDYYLLDNDKQKQLYKVLTEYSMTPIEEREEEPQYQYFIHTIQGMNMNEYTGTHLCLNYDIETKEWCFNDDYNSGDYQTIFTDKELEEYGVDPQELKEKYDWIRVN